MHPKLPIFKLSPETESFILYGVGIAWIIWFLCLLVVFGRYIGRDSVLRELLMVDPDERQEVFMDMCVEENFQDVEVTEYRIWKRDEEQRLSRQSYMRDRGYGAIDWRENVHESSV